MNKKYVQVVCLFLISILSVFVSVKWCYWVAEHYFFDKFFYKKSITYGYLGVTKDLFRYGDRAKEITWLKETGSDKQKILGAETELGTYTLAIIGDSYVWGQGIKNEDRFATLLEKKLNSIRKTKVYSFGLPGDNLLENYEKLKILQSGRNFDLYIYVLTYNDILINTGPGYDRSLSENIRTECEKLGPLVLDYIDNGWTQYSRTIQRALYTDSNQCIAKNFFESLPQNTIIFDPDSIFDGNKVEHNIYVSLASSANLKWISLEDYGNALPTAGGINSLSTSWRVSNLEGHPSALANKYFADILFKAIQKIKQTPQ